MKRITNNYGMGLERELEQYTKLRDIAVESGYEEDVITSLNHSIDEVKYLIECHKEETA